MSDPDLEPELKPAGRCCIWAMLPPWLATIIALWATIWYAPAGWRTFIYTVVVWLVMVEIQVMIAMWHVPGHVAQDTLKRENMAAKSLDALYILAGLRRSLKQLLDVLRGR